MMMYHLCCFYLTNPIPTYTAEYLECFVKVMCEDTTLKCTILTSLENKKNMENKKKKPPARTIKISKKDDKLMIFFKAP